MSTDSNAPFPKSPYPPLTLPEGGFKSNLPEHLLADADPATRWIMEQLSKNTQAVEWACHGLTETHAQVRLTNGRLLKAEASIKDDEAKLDVLNEKASVMEPIFKPLSQFMGLWDYTWFRYICYAALFLFFTYLLPYYVAHPFSIETVFNHFLSP